LVDVTARADENCEFFRGAAPATDLLHIVCAWHGGRGVPTLPQGPDPHFIVNLTHHPVGHPWTYVGSIDWPGEATPVYEGGAPGDAASVRYFIARTETETNVTTAGRAYKQLGIGLYKLEWLLS